MFKHLLIPTDGTALSARAVKAGIAIVMASHGRREGMLLGSVTNQVLSHSKIPVLVYR
jgi:nucleotide-binding universal stress UspA family protein